MAKSRKGTRKNVSEGNVYIQATFNNTIVTITDRMNYISPMANNIAWHHACEKLFGIELTPRCKVIRTIIAELARIQDHLLCVGTAALDLGALTAFLYNICCGIVGGVEVDVR